MPISNRSGSGNKTRQGRVAKDYQQLAGSSKRSPTGKKDWLPYFMQRSATQRPVGCSGRWDKIEPLPIRPTKRSKSTILLDTATQKKQLRRSTVSSMTNKRGYYQPSDLRSQIWPAAGRYRQLAEKPIPTTPGLLYAWVGKIYYPKLWGGDKKKARELLRSQSRIRQQCIRRY